MLYICLPLNERRRDVTKDLESHWKIDLLDARDKYVLSNDFPNRSQAIRFLVEKNGTEMAVQSSGGSVRHHHVQSGEEGDRLSDQSHRTGLPRCDICRPTTISIVISACTTSLLWVRLSG